MTNLFNSRALQRRHRVGDHNGPITLLSPPLKATLALGVLIALGGGLWATLARIPLTVEGTGVLLPVGAIATTVSPSSGVAQLMFDQPSAAWQQQALQFQQSPGSFNQQTMAQLARSILLASESQEPQALTAGPSKQLPHHHRGKQIARGQLLVWVQVSDQRASLSSALNQLERSLRASEAQQRNITAQQNVLRSQLRSRSSYLASMKKLEAKGFVSRTSILDEQATVDGIGSQINSNANQIIAFARDRDQAYQALRSQLASLVQQQLIFAPRDLYIDQVLFQNGEAVSRGQELLKHSHQPLIDPSLVPVFLSTNEMAQVRPGMKALVTPAGYKRAEVGGIRGLVVFKDRIPGNVETVTDLIGVRSLAEQIVAQEPSPVLVHVKLQRAQGKAVPNSGGYLWSSGSDLPFAPTPGERLDVEFTTRLVRPIDLVLPSLKRWLGLTPPDVPAAAGGVRS
ncbi:MAG: hypothetical protein ACK6BM_03600 [Cyanobacteriota bacterium]|jgi:hypothetical protein